MHKDKHQHETSPQDIAAFTKDSTDRRKTAKPGLTESERNDELFPKPLVKIVNLGTGGVTQASLAQLNEQMREFEKVILLIEDQASASEACARVLHELGYDGVQLITQLMAAEQHLADIVANLTSPPALIVLDLGLGLDSGFTVLRTCHAQPQLQQIPIVVWTKHTDRLAKTFSDYLGARAFLVKSSDEWELREVLKQLLGEKAVQRTRKSPSAPRSSVKPRESLMTLDRPCCKQP